MKKNKYFLPVVLIGIVLHAAQALSLEPESKKSALVLPAIVITPSRMDATSLKVPGAVNVITLDDIENSNAQVITDVLRYSTGVAVRDELGNGKSVTVDMRGFGETGKMNLLVLIDGRRINNIDLSGTDWTQIPLDQVERIEISRGSSSVLYGDNAVEGVINIITKRGEGPLKAAFSTLYGSYDKRALKTEASGSLGKASMNLNASYSDMSGYRENNELETKDIASSIFYDVTDCLKFNISSGFHEDTYGLPGPLYVSDLSTKDRRDSKYPLDNADIQDYYVKAGAEADIKLFGYELGKVIPDFSYRRRDSDSFFGSGYVMDSSTNLWNFNPRYVFNAEFLEHFKNDLIVGSDYFFGEHDIDSGAVSGEKDDIEITKRTLGFYGLDSFTLFDLVSLQLGYRYEWAKFRFYQIHGSLGAIHNDQIKKIEEGVLTAGLSYYLTEKTNLYASYAQSYRLPNSDEFYGSLPWGTGLNTNLKPQEGDDYEIGIKHYYKDIFYMAGNLFYMNIQDEIYYDPFTWTNSNYDKTERRGLELEAKIMPVEKLSLFSNYTYTRAKLKGGSYDNRYIPLVPQHNIRVGGDYEVMDGLILSAFSSFVGSRYKLSDLRNAAPKAKPYFVTDAKASYEYKNLKVTAGVNNVFNERYAEVEGYTSSNQEYLYPSPERNYYVGAQVSF